MGQKLTCCYIISVILGNFRSDSDQEFINYLQLHKFSRVLYQFKTLEVNNKRKVELAWNWEKINNYT